MSPSSDVWRRECQASQVRSDRRRLEAQRRRHDRLLPRDLRTWAQAVALIAVAAVVVLTVAVIR